MWICRRRCHVGNGSDQYVPSRAGGRAGIGCGRALAGAQSFDPYEPEKEFAGAPPPLSPLAGTERLPMFSGSLDWPGLGSNLGFFHHMSLKKKSRALRLPCPHWRAPKVYPPLILKAWKPGVARSGPWIRPGFGQVWENIGFFFLSPPP